MAGHDHIGYRHGTQRIRRDGRVPQAHDQQRRICAVRQQRTDLRCDRVDHLQKRIAVRFEDTGTENRAVPARFAADPLRSLLSFYRDAVYFDIAAFDVLRNYAVDHALLRRGLHGLIDQVRPYTDQMDHLTGIFDTQGFFIHFAKNT